jgi:hypothetical protein
LVPAARPTVQKEIRRAGGGRQFLRLSFPLGAQGACSQGRSESREITW